MKTSFDHTAEHGDVGGKSKSPHEASAHSQDRNRGQPAFKKKVLPIHPSNSLRTNNPMEQHFTSLKLSINEVFNTFKVQPGVRCPRPIQFDPSLSGAEEYCSYYDSKGTRPSTVGLSGSTWKSSSNKVFSKSTFHSQSSSGFGQLNDPPPIQP